MIVLEFPECGCYGSPGEMTPVCRVSLFFSLRFLLWLLFLVMEFHDFGGWKPKGSGTKTRDTKLNLIYRLVNNLKKKNFL